MKISVKSILSGSAASDTLLFNIAWLLFRFYCGYSIAKGAGLAKVFHKIDEKGGEGWDNLAFGVPDWFVKQVGEIGFTFISSSFWAHLAVYGEFIGGLFIAVGFLTRISALQLAFQFFVVSFIWYDEPMPFDMYYQQLIFWGFVLIATVGGGRFSLDAWLERRKLRTHISTKNLAAAACLLLLPLAGFSQKRAEPERVSFTVSNPGLKTREIDIRYFDCVGTRAAGYGYTLNALSSHAVNMPIGTRIYVKNNRVFDLVFVVTAADNGRKFDITEEYEISREQWLQASNDEQNAATEGLEMPGERPDWERVAKEKGYRMVTFKVSGESLLPKEVHVRVQLPFENQKSNVGFSRTLSRISLFQVSYPVGSKVYFCDGPYWKDGNVKETLLFTVNAKTANSLCRI